MLGFVFLFPWSSHRGAIQKGIQSSSDWDGVGHWYVLSLPANQSHEECFAAARRVSHFTTPCSEGLRFSWCFAIVFDFKSSSPEALTLFDVHIDSLSAVEFWMNLLRSRLAPPLSMHLYFELENQSLQRSLCWDKPPWAFTFAYQGNIKDVIQLSDLYSLSMTQGTKICRTQLMHCPSADCISCHVCKGPAP